MPTIHVFDGYKIAIYADDHAPPHFHLIGPDGEAQIDIRTLQVIRGRFRPKILAQAIERAGEHQEALLQKWSELNERD